MALELSVLFSCGWLRPPGRSRDTDEVTDRGARFADAISNSTAASLPCPPESAFRRRRPSERRWYELANSLGNGRERLTQVAEDSSLAPEPPLT